MPSQCYESFFTSLAFDFWRAAVPLQATQSEVEFLVKTLGASPPARVLDLPCGTGRHALELARRGFAVTGIDLSAAGLAQARAEASQLGLDVQFLRGDMRGVVPGAPFDAAYCFGNSFGYLSHDDMQRFVRNVSDAVRPGGRWVIDTGAAAECLLPNLSPGRELEAGGVTYTVESRYDAWGGRLVQSCVLSRGAEREVSEISHGVYTVAELRRLLEAQPWEVVSALGTLDGEPFHLGHRRLLLIATRTDAEPQRMAS